MDILKLIGEIAIGIIGLGIMIFIHELGHLIAAKALGLKVETFSLGYGKKLVGFEMGGTTYQIAVFPFGGFCKMQGEHLFAKAVEENLDKIPDDEDHYYKAPPYKRIIVSFAGAGANLLFAFLCLTFLFTIGFNEYTLENKIILASDFPKYTGAITETPADLAGLKTGDRIISINGRETRHWIEVVGMIERNPEENLALKVLRDGRTIPLTIIPEFDSDAVKGKIGVMAWRKPIIETIGPLMKEANPWLKTGDQFISMNNTPIRHTVDFSIALADKSRSLPVVIERQGRQITEMMKIPVNDKNELTLDIGFQTLIFRTPEYSLFGAAERGFTELSDTVVNIFKFFSWLFTKNVNLSNALGGPIKTTVLIGVATGQSLERGFDYGIINFFRMIAFISIVLAIMNLLPLPMLDGGFIVLFAIEWLRKKPWRPRFLMRFQLVGIVLFAILFIFILFLDIPSLPNLF